MEFFVRKNTFTQKTHVQMHFKMEHLNTDQKRRVKLKCNFVFPAQTLCLT